MPQVSVESNRYQLASSEAAANDATATILLPVTPRTLPPGNTKLHDAFEWAVFQILVRTQLVLTEVLTCICLIDGCLSGEKSRDRDTHTKSVTRPCNIKSLHVTSQRDNTMRIWQRA